MDSPKQTPYISLEPACTFDSPGVTRLFLLYIEEKIYDPFKLGHDGGTSKELIATFTDVYDLNEFTGRVFGVPYLSLTDCFRQLRGCAQYSVEILPLFQGLEHVKTYADRLREDILRMVPPHLRPGFDGFNKANLAEVSRQWQLHEASRNTR